MDIEKATEILEDAVITEPSIKSYAYISAEDINEAINMLLKELQHKEEIIKDLNKLLAEKIEKNKKSVVMELIDKLEKTRLLEKTT